MHFEQLNGRNLRQLGSTRKSIALTRCDTCNRGRKLLNFMTAPDHAPLRCCIGGDVMVLAIDFRRQARVCVRLAEECEDQHLAERLRLMAADMTAKADDIEELPSERLRRATPLLAA